MGEKKNTGPGTKHPSGDYTHDPVMVKEVLALLHTGKNKTFVDGTVGLGGHAEAILKETRPHGKLLGVDRDQEALRIAEERLPPDRTVLKHGTFDQVPQMLQELGWPEIDGMLLDLGVSSLQFEKGERGFSFKKSSALDMRMDLEEEVTARELLDDLPEKDLEAIFREFGEEKFSKRIARQIVRKRQREKIETTDDLRNLVSRAVPFSKNRKIHPATRVFQALRIAVNRELDILEKFLKEPPNFIRVDGVLAVLTYHSLEDRIVKWAFRSYDNFKVLTKKPLQPNKLELQRNPRSRSAKLRAVQREE
jgi:16S rRNA (cytosine1402-N4)-methyltransferase